MFSSQIHQKKIIFVTAGLYDTGSPDNSIPVLYRIRLNTTNAGRSSLRFIRERCLP